MQKTKARQPYAPYSRRASDLLLVAANLKLTTNFAAGEVAWPGVGRRNSVVGVDVHVSVAAANLPQRVGERHDATRADGGVSDGFTFNVAPLVTVPSASTPSCLPVGPVSAPVDVTVGNSQMKIPPLIPWGPQ